VFESVQGCTGFRDIHTACLSYVFAKVTLTQMFLVDLLREDQNLTKGKKIFFCLKQTLLTVARFECDTCHAPSPMHGDKFVRRLWKQQVLPSLRHK